mmetsp:Transcript_29823/g.54633  ORF Transcript_29823/g.54633 Transcript_29823/m.54633 type:complete len:373 (-) Transcript_29823:967-2085(-)|eukprot:CAMPEP_0175059392 /NCGR_PEP_ID=MMETSP0052_2-20121109/12408_1 /TAXON_ID=51329 ORGANISM="Polytomella parva, Strain SAG 63-3" /NCGR_SAMPLE_ID=MMETSP0052_2 /ASSEMBLY_ACC=CAM_ASM_000194 /LENGTH=372 /DNA_ID=CAMNT_0016324939 /DNA_START=122 /DNA_END=1240 /DNA_ORIENTATION=+
MGISQTVQERIDLLTIKIDNPNVVGSGFIQLPPQRPFEKPVYTQPPTVAHLAHPEQYQDWLAKQAKIGASTGAPTSQSTPIAAPQSAPRPAPTYGAPPQRIPQPVGAGYPPQRAPGQYVPSQQAARPVSAAPGQPAYRPMQQQQQPYGGQNVRPVSVPVAGPQYGSRPGYRPGPTPSSGPAPAHGFHGYTGIRPQQQQQQQQQQQPQYNQQQYRPASGASGGFSGRPVGAPNSTGPAYSAGASKQVGSVYGGSPGLSQNYNRGPVSSSNGLYAGAPQYNRPVSARPAGAPHNANVPSRPAGGFHYAPAEQQQGRPASAYHSASPATASAAPIQRVYQPVEAVAKVSVDNDRDEDGLTKSQKKRLRKKSRDDK